MTTSYRIDFQPVGRRGESPSENSLLDAARQMGVGISGICGGHGKCQSCKVKILEGKVSGLTPSEEEAFTAEQLQEGWRLACQAHPAADCRVSVPAESMTAPQRTQVEGLEIRVPPEPLVRAYKVKLKESTLANVRADDQSLLQTLNRENDLSCTKTDIQVLRRFSPLLRSWGWECQGAVTANEIIGVSPWPSPVLGFAVDLGTTKIAGYLVDLKDGRTLASKGVMNPQISYGEDIISRIQGTLSSPGVGADMQRVAVEALNHLATDLCQEARAAVTDIVDSVIVSNTAMHHLLLGLPVKQLVLAPFVPAGSRALDCKARDIGLKLALGAYVHFLPNIAGFVGGDHVAMLLATVQEKPSGLAIALDVGTNTEVSLIDGEKISSVSCASGPAFEGYHIRHGMRAARGAIERVRIENDKVQIETIDNAPPAGICGSGVLDAMSQLHLAGVVDGSGRMLEGHPRVRIDQENREFVLVEEGESGAPMRVVLTQHDIRELQLAKAAIRTGIQVLLATNGRKEQDLDQVIIAGAFGSYIDVASAVAIGMMPRIPLERFRQVGNAAGTGARMALISSSQRTKAQTLAARVKYVELGSAPQFTETFLNACSLTT
jgi:uncharacterized 2Fe-2S/4Fe-4S cluster protein (DUF4445 family)